MSEYINPTNFWKDCLVEIETTLSKANFNTWFKKTYILKEDDGNIIIAVPNEFIKEWLHTKYYKFILKIARTRESSIKNIEFVISKRDNDESKKEPQKKDSEKDLNHPSLPLQDLYINKKDNLNTKYTFQNFIIGPFNELAYSAAQATILRPTIYNPLYIYGQTGLGKTHLIQAIGNKLKENNQNVSVYYTNTEKFSIDVIQAVNSGAEGNNITKTSAFRNKYRNFDVLIIDDIQFLSGKEKTQEELFHLFNTLFEKGKQVIFSSDKHPNYISGLQDRLKSRFSAGMIVDVSKPEYESRYAIIKSKTEEQQTPIPDAILEYIAMSIEGNIRELEGIVNLYIIHARLKKRDLTLDEVKNLIKNNIKPKRQVSVHDVIKTISNFYSIDFQFIYDKTRRKEIVHSRQIIMYILREDFSISYPVIGKELGGRDHTTVMHSYEKIKGELKDNPTLIQEIDQIRTILSNQ